MDRDLVKILGFNVDKFSFDEALDYVLSSKGQVVTINPEMIIHALSNPEFKNVIDNADLVIPDGIGVEIGLKILGHSIHRIAGIDFGKALIKKIASQNKTIAMVGAKSEVIESAIKNLKSEIENVNIIYSHDGYFEDESQILNELITCNPDLVLVALGSPKQELFISQLKSKLPGTVFIGLGGSFDVWSGYVDRAPSIFQKLGFEWLYRTIKEPKRIKRIFPTIPLFLFRVLKERVTG